jgi:hypothetical protein
VAVRARIGRRVPPIWISPLTLSRAMEPGRGDIARVEGRVSSSAHEDLLPMSALVIGPKRDGRFGGMQRGDL